MVNDCIATPEKKSGVELRATASTTCSDFADDTNLADLPILDNQSSADGSKKFIKEFKPFFSTGSKHSTYDEDLDKEDSQPSLRLFSARQSVGDRYIPLRSSSKLQLAFQRLNTEMIDDKTDDASSLDQTSEDNQAMIFRDYLRTTLLDDPPQAYSSLQNPTLFSNKNLFTYSEGKRRTALE
mgnify:CR=1 FL=1